MNYSRHCLPQQSFQFLRIAQPTDPSPSAATVTAEFDVCSGLVEK
jgi:hypothetical protein